MVRVLLEVANFIVPVVFVKSLETVVLPVRIKSVARLLVNKL